MKRACTKKKEKFFTGKFTKGMVLGSQAVSLKLTIILSEMDFCIIALLWGTHKNVNATKAGILLFICFFFLELYPLGKWFSKFWGGGLPPPPQGHLSMSEDVYDCHRQERNVVNAQWAEARLLLNIRECTGSSHRCTGGPPSVHRRVPIKEYQT